MRKQWLRPGVSDGGGTRGSNLVYILRTVPAGFAHRLVERLREETHVFLDLSLIAQEERCDHHLHLTRKAVKSMDSGFKISFYHLSGRVYKTLHSEFLTLRLLPRLMEFSYTKPLVQGLNEC